MELFDNGAERAVLAGIMQYGSEAYVEVCDIINENSFGTNNNQVLFKCFKHIIDNGQTVDLPCILAASEKLNFSDIIQTDQELNYIKSLKDFYINKENIFSFAVQIKKYEFARGIKSMTSKIIQEIDNIDGSETIDEIIGIMENPITAFLREEDSGERPELIGTSIVEYLDFLAENQCDIVGIPTGFKRFDEAIGGGLRRKCVDLIAARPKTGKSVFADAVAINVCSLDNPIPTLMLDTEMSEEDHRNRILASMSGVPINEIATGRFANNEEKRNAVYEAAKKLATMPYFYVCIAGKPFDQILNLIKRWVLHEVKTDESGNTNDCLIIYDYLKLMSSSSIDKNMQEYQALGFQITSLHNLCVKLDVPCLSFVQLNRDGITKESTDAVSGSDRLVWLCTSFTIFKNKSPEEIAEDGVKNGNRKLVPIVARHGGGLFDGDYINMNMAGEIARLTELKTRNESRFVPENDGGFISEDSADEINQEYLGQNS